ncbi:MAG TPA: DUF2147 domain-containing protein [Mucilaginibacter sp.]|jgi:uncharacterized protein (DUF2147 family)
MNVKFLFILFALLFFSGINLHANVASPDEQICGKWESSEKNLIVQVYKADDTFRAKVIWYTDTGGKPMDYWTDKRNPNPALRSRKILGMSVLKDMAYNAATNSWENGMIYESKYGRQWNASAYIDKNGVLKVKGYWHFKFIGRTMAFTRV